ncbi:MAG: ShlB/FhaC/HecB family hemolysin secretion/activation protein [Pseudomonadota bacterium]
MDPLRTPGVAGQTREELERKSFGTPQQDNQQRISDETKVERAPCALDNDNFKDISIKLDNVQFGDLRGIDAGILTPSYKRYIGQTIPISTVCIIRDEAATILRGRGYLAAVQIPPQKIDGGSVKFDVLLAKLVNFQVRGNVGKSGSLISSYLEAIKNQPIFNVADAERYLLLARDIPGYDVRLTLRPAGTNPGEVIGDVQVSYTPVEADVNIQNYGSKAVGRFGGISQVRFNGLLGIGDQTTLGFFSSSDFKEQLVGQFGQEIKLGPQGLTLGGGLTYAVTKPDIAGGAGGLTSKTLIGGLSLRYPALRSLAKNVNLSGGLDIIDQRARSSGSLITNDKLRVIYGKLDVDAVDSESLSGSGGYTSAEPRWRVAGTLELRQGIGALGSSLDCGTLIRCASRNGADATAFVVRASGYGEIRPIRNLVFSLAPRVQYAKKPLLSFEEFSTGNYTIGRGYDPGILSGDRGVAAAGEIKVGSLIAKTAKSVAVQGYVFGDAAVVWNRDTASLGMNPEKLYSAGGGVRLGYDQRINLDLGAAVPLKKAGLQTKRGDIRILANLTIRLLPWKR